MLRVRRLRAQALEGLGDLEEALREIEDLRRDAQEARRYDEHLRLTVDAVRCYQEAGDVAYALDVGEAALASVRSWGLTGTDTHAELASSVLGAYYVRGDVVRAQQMATEVLDVVGAAGSAQARAAVYWNASLLSEQRDDIPAALMLAERALADVGSEVDVADCDTEFGRCELLLGRPEHALSLADSALARLGSEPRVERAHTTLVRVRVRARSLLALDRLEEAVTTYREAAGALSAGDLNSQAASAWRELADAFAQLGLLEDATLAYQQALTDAGVRAAPDISYASTPSYSDG